MSDKFIKCECHSHALEVHQFEGEDITTLIFWGYDSGAYPWSYIFKMIWELLTTRRLSIQEFVLNPETKKELIKLLKKS